jgi:hypothetical protein
MYNPNYQRMLSPLDNITVFINLITRKCALDVLYTNDLFHGKAILV